MSDALLTRDGDLGIITLSGVKVNALTEQTVSQLRSHLAELAADDSVRAVVLTGAGDSFFSFGWDVPHFLDFDPSSFREFLQDFTAAYRELFVFPKPLVAALNGHTIAGGAMLATSCDRRVMVGGRAKISLNEVTFGASLFAGLTEILRDLVGGKAVRQITLSGAMYSADEALTIGWIDETCSPEELMPRAIETVGELAEHDATAFTSIKALIRQEVVAKITEREAASIEEFLRIWYAPDMRERLARIEIRR